MQQIFVELIENDAAMKQNKELIKLYFENTNNWKYN